ncbi:beta-N-acetylhexosaminidase [Streptacidiphilus sp. PB12-B1b]|uniref:glycoside hydrolase family 3 N-terminal domain-containing protein n=1 Tax=Streptacidiphilus sp. PB12-B1b TaxID=2705012 RepID=UPI0015FAB811|nr:glycoside hydrolase family 3 N-terminal domain-containing protein [Streptacidiphilus sp. PB12-B1b]QMU77115.1 beta-N-acetylhexosaminidase [Streptacidiphilus sp. PB12-B1b]
MDHPGNPLSRRSTLFAGAGLAAAAAGLCFAAPTAAEAGPASDLASRLTPEQLAGQRVVFSYPGTTVPQALLDRIAGGVVGGVILFGENVSSLAQVTAAVQQLHEAAQGSPVRAPLLVMTDQEGGRVRRLPGGPVLSQKQIGASPDPARAAAEAGREAGQLLRGAGLNVNLAPVLDVFRAPGDFIDQFGRSYSSNPEVVSVCGRAFIEAQQAAGVAATAKHFPGLGPAATGQNTDLGPVTLTTPLAELRGVDERPYGPAIAAGVDLAMVSWAVHTALDPHRPAGLSARVVEEELRRRHGFRGVTVTDAIDAGALKPFGTAPQNAVAAATAGMDLILEASRDVANGQAVVDGLAQALADGRLGFPGFTAALDRIIRLRQRLA